MGERKKEEERYNITCYRAFFFFRRGPFPDQFQIRLWFPSFEHRIGRIAPWNDQ